MHAKTFCECGRVANYGPRKEDRKNGLRFTHSRDDHPVCARCWRANASSNIVKTRHLRPSSAARDVTPPPVAFDTPELRALQAAHA